VRLFVACELPAAVADGLAGWAARATGRDTALRLLGVGQLHLTLVFLGEVAADEVDVVAEVVVEALRDEPWPSALRIGEPLWLAPGNPQALVVGISDEDGALTALQSRLVAGLGEAIGFAPERRRYLPHVTVARLRRGRLPRDYDLDPPPAPIAFAGESVELVRSQLQPDGARYETVLRVTPEDT
jgi:2'-5' RNA ligase